MQDWARGLCVEQQSGLGGSSCSWAFLVQVDDRPADVGDLKRNVWRWQIAGDYIAAVRAGPGYAIAPGCKLGG